MSKIKKSTLICVLAFFIFGLFLSDPSNAQDLKTLENGLKVIIKEDRRNPLVVFSVFISVGAAREKNYPGSGISHLTEHMLFKGTQKYPQGAIEDILHKYGGNIDGFTSFDYTGFRITILKEHADIAIDILKEMLTSPLFDPKELEKEKGVIEREMDLGRDDPGKRISRLTFSGAYTTHPYRIPVIGFKENFGRLTRDDLVAFFGNNYTPEKMVVAVVGDIDAGKIDADIRSAFGDIPRGKNMIHAFPSEPPQAGERYIEEKMGIEGAYLNVAFHSASLLDKDLYALDILSFILGQGDSSILNKRIRFDRELVNYVSCYNYTPRDPGLFVISCVLKEENAGDALSGILNAVDYIKENGVSEEDLAKARNNFIAEYIYGKETIESRANDIAIGELLTGNHMFFELYIERIKSVKREDLREAANRYLNRENMTVAAVSGSGNTLGLSSEPDRGGREERTIKKIILKNNLPVLISKNPSLPILSLSLVAKGGLRFETKKDNGIARLTSLILTDGTGSMSREEIAGFCESRGMAIAPYSAKNSMGISISCLKEYGEYALMMLSDLYINSAVPEKELEREKRETKFAIDTQDNQLFHRGHRLLKELLFSVHPYGLEETGTHESIDGITKADVLGFYSGVLSAENAVLGIAGDCDIDEMERLTEKYFSEMPSGKLDVKLPEKEPAITGTRKIALNTDKAQSLFMLGFHGVDVYSRDIYATEIMVDILSSESGILFKKVREKEGLSYAQGAFQISGIDPGYIVIYVLTSKKNVDKVKDIIFKEMASFAKNGPSAGEIEKTKNHLKAMRQMDLQTNSGFIFMASLDELYGLGYDHYKDYNKNIDLVTREDVKRVTGKLLDPDRCAMVILKGLND